MRVVAVAVVAVAALAGCSGDAGNEVAIVSGRRFEPVRLTVPVGTTVTWSNGADDAHSVTAYQEAVPEGAAYFSSGGFDSESEARDNLAEALIGNGESYEVMFERPGTYEYFCIPHEADGMKGTIVVEG